MEATLGDKKFESFGTSDFETIDNSTFVEEICRGIAVNTKYSSNIQVSSKCSKVITDVFSNHSLIFLQSF